MNINTLDPVVLNEDLPAHGLRRGDVGAVVEEPDLFCPGIFAAEFVVEEYDVCFPSKAHFKTACL